MAVMITAENAGQTQPGYDGMFAVPADVLRRAPGCILHTSYPVEGGWRVIEVWESKAQANQFFAQHVAPKLAPGIHPRRSVQELHAFATR